MNTGIFGMLCSAICAVNVQMQLQRSILEELYDHLPITVVLSDVTQNHLILT